MVSSIDYNDAHGAERGPMGPAADATSAARRALREGLEHSRLEGRGFDLIDAKAIAEIAESSYLAARSPGHDRSTHWVSAYSAKSDWLVARALHHSSTRVLAQEEERREGICWDIIVGIALPAGLIGLLVFIYREFGQPLAQPTTYVAVAVLGVLALLLPITAIFRKTVLGNLDSPYMAALLSSRLITHSAGAMAGAAVLFFCGSLLVQRAAEDHMKERLEKLNEAAAILLASREINVESGKVQSYIEHETGVKWGYVGASSTQGYAHFVSSDGGAEIRGVSLEASELSSHYGIGSRRRPYARYVLGKIVDSSGASIKMTILPSSGSTAGALSPLSLDLPEGMFPLAIGSRAVVGIDDLNKVIYIQQVDGVLQQLQRK